MRYDAEVDALYLRLREGEVAATIEVEEMVYLDVDNEGRAVGIEFVSGADFLPFLQRQGGHSRCRIRWVYPPGRLPRNTHSG
ncbi:MAG: DUF2283 domain-containing protein [Chloroflexia bacterium]|nr:DUF2283 domain-containing protein [Chloroflexia bacterium]